MTINLPNLTEEHDFLFVMEIKDAAYYKSRPELVKYLQVLPQSIRVYAVIHAGMNTLKVYCITKSHNDYESVTSLTGAKTEKLNSNSFENN